MFGRSLETRGQIALRADSRVGIDAVLRHPLFLNLFESASRSAAPSLAPPIANLSTDARALGMASVSSPSIYIVTLRDRMNRGQGSQNIVIYDREICGKTVAIAHPQGLPERDLR